MFVLSQAVKKSIAGQKMAWELLSSSQMQLVFLKLVNTADFCMLPEKIPALKLHLEPRFTCELSMIKDSSLTIAGNALMPVFSKNL